MTIKNAIALTDSMTYNQIDAPEKVMWLSNLDWVIHRDVHACHEGTKDIPYAGYNGDTDLDTELLVPPPYDEIYRWYLEMQISDANGEVARYNNAMVKYNATMLSYMDYINRTHMPIGQSQLKLI